MATTTGSTTASGEARPRAPAALGGFLSLDQVAARLGCSASEVEQLIERGPLVGRRFAFVVKISEQDLAAFLTRRSS